jgi:hypothetical protein
MDLETMKIIAATAFILAIAASAWMIHKNF